MRARVLVVVVAVAALAALAPMATGGVPYPNTGGDPYDYTRLHITNGDCTGPKAATADLPKTFNCKDSSKLTDYAPQPGDSDYDPAVANNPQELFGVKGAGTNHAWEVTTGRPDTVISVMDSGIMWNTPELADKVALNPGELPVPGATRVGGSARAHDVNHDGVFNVLDYAGDPRVADLNHNGLVDPQDLIRTFPDGKDRDGTGYAADLA